MPWIRIIDEDEAAGPLKELYDLRRREAGFVSNAYKVASLKPELAWAMERFRKSIIFGGSSLGRRREEIIAVVQAAVAKCSYSGVSHGEMLRSLIGGDGAKVAQLGRDWRACDWLDDQERAICAFVEKLTRSQSELTAADVQSLRDVGFDDEGILDVTLVAAYRNYITRVLDALGIEINDESFQSPEIVEALLVGDRALPASQRERWGGASRTGPADE